MAWKRSADGEDEEGRKEIDGCDGWTWQRLVLEEQLSLPRLLVLHPGAPPLSLLLLILSQLLGLVLLFSGERLKQRKAERGRRRQGMCGEERRSMR